MSTLKKPNAPSRPRSAAWRNSFAAALVPVVALLILPALEPCAHAQESGPSEYQVKAAFLYKFTRFIEWPSNSFADASAPFVVAILGDNPFGSELERAIRGKDVAGHPFVVREIKSVAEAKGCHILFVSRSERRRLAEIISAVGSSPVLTVGEVDRFLASGGIINFFMEENKVRFEINDAAGKRAGLKISSKLLYLGRRPERGGSK